MAEQDLVGISVSRQTYARLQTAAQLRQRGITEVLEDVLEGHEMMRADILKRMEEALDQSLQQALLDGTSEMTMERSLKASPWLAARDARWRRPADTSRTRHQHPSVGHVDPKGEPGEDRQLVCFWDSCGRDFERGDRGVRKSAGVREVQTFAGCFASAPVTLSSESSQGGSAQAPGGLRRPVG